MIVPKNNTQYPIQIQITSGLSYAWTTPRLPSADIPAKFKYRSSFKRRRIATSEVGCLEAI